VQLGKALSIETLAEGIEQTRELSVLQGEQCDSGQGFLYARPLDVEATEAFLESYATSLQAHATSLQAVSQPSARQSTTP
jgi:EAL domain-containing protein (putative c-di-GMP-specific phosphodiesterase class I)